MVLADAYHSSALDQAYPSSPPYWQVDMDPHHRSIHPGPARGQVYSVPRVHEAASSAIQGWTGQPQTPTRTMAYIPSQKRVSGDSAYGLVASDAMMHQPIAMTRNGRPSHLVLASPVQSLPSSDLPQLTSQLALESTPLHPESPYAPSTSSIGSEARNSAGSIYGYQPASEVAGPTTLAPRPRAYEQQGGMIPGYTYQQLVPQQATIPMTHPSPSSSINWSETYTSAPSTSYSTSPVYATGHMQSASAGPSHQYSQPVLVEPPMWQYQHVPVQVFSPEGSSSAPVHYVMSSSTGSSHQNEQQHATFAYQATSAPQTHYMRAPEYAHMATSEGGLDSGSGPVRSRVRRKVPIGRVRLPEPEHATSHPAPGTFTEQPWAKMAQSQTQSGAFTHSGVYGLDPSMPAYAGRWPADQGVVPVDSFPFETTAPLQRPSSIEGYYPPETAGLYNNGQVSVPATVATSHVPLPLVSQLPPPLTMNTMSTSVMGSSMLQTGTPASLCHSTFSSDEDEPNEHVSSDPAYDDYHGGNSYAHAHVPSRPGHPSRASTFQVGSTNFDGFSRVPLAHTRAPHALEVEDDGEELQDVHTVYPGLGAGYDLSSTAEDSSAPSTAGWGQAGPSNLGRKRVMQRSSTVGTLPAHFDGMDYSRYGSKGNRPKLAIACQGCRDKKLKCSGERPTCMNCKRRGIDVCEYAESVRRRGPGRKKIAALEKKANSEARRQAKARLQNSQMHQEDVASQYFAMQPEAYAYQA